LIMNVESAYVQKAFEKNNESEAAATQGNA